MIFQEPQTAFAYLGTGSPTALRLIRAQLRVCRIGRVEQSLPVCCNNLSSDEDNPEQKADAKGNCYGS